jgi:TRAP-type C4-dicarboxylate transport system permease large subunit
MGVFTPSEIGAFAVIYAIVIGLFAHRMLTLAGFREAVESTLVDIGAVMFLLTLSPIFGYGIISERIPEIISGWMLGFTEDADLAMVFRRTSQMGRRSPFGVVLLNGLVADN